MNRISDEDQKINEGHLEAIKEEIKEADKTHEKVNEMAATAHDTLLRMKAVFPFDFFPDEVNVDIHKVSIIRRALLSSTVHSVFIKDVSDVLVTNGIFFASLEIVDLGFVENTIKVNYLKKREAEEARKIIQGLIVAAKRNVDLSRVHRSDSRSKMAIIGHVHGL